LKNIRRFVLKTTKEDYFTIIPNKLFYSASANEYSIFKLVNDAKVVLVFDYFYTNMNRHKEIKFTIEDMVSSCGYIPNANAGRINSQFKKIIVTLYKNKLIKFKCKDKFIEFEQDNNIDFNIEKIRYTQLYTCTLNIDLSLKFIQLYEKEKSIILDFKDTDQKMKIDNTKLLLYYCYIKSRVYKRNKDDDIQISGGRAEVAYPSFNTIYKDLHFTDKTIKKYNDLLVKLDMIRYDNAGLWYYKNDKNKIVRESVNFYTLFYGNEDIAKKI
jgi:hypothetical protein